MPFKVYAAIAKAAVKETPTDDLGDVAEAFKKKCAQQGLPYDADITTKALNTATRRRA